MSKPKKNRLPYHAETRNSHFGIRRGNPWRVLKSGKVLPSGESSAEVYGGKQQ